MKRTFLTLSILAISLAHQSRAATVALFTNDETNGTASFADEAAASNVTVSDLVFGDTPNGAPTSDGAFSTYVGTGLQFLASNFSTSTNLSSADAADRFAIFSITADSGYTISLSESDVISYTVGANSTNGFEIYTRSLFYVSDQSDFSNILFESPYEPGVSENTANVDRWRGEDYTLSPSAGAVGDYQTLYFALELSVSNNTSNGTKHAIVSEISFDGSVVPVPEPSSLALLGLGGLCILRRRRG
jgi:hypothetical protein